MARYSVIHRDVKDTHEVYTDDLGRIITYQCPRCPWYRSRTNTEAWEKLIIQHPNYGHVSNFDAYKYDIATHECELTRAERHKYGIPNVKRTKDPYTYREDHNGPRRAD